jgi:hypothetical protein
MRETKRPYCIILPRITNKWGEIYIFFWGRYRFLGGGDMAKNADVCPKKQAYGINKNEHELPRSNIIRRP